MGAALALRLLVIILADPRFDVGDGRNYNIIARSLLDAGVYSFSGPPAYEPSVVRPPLFPFLLAGIYAVFGVSHGAMQLVHVALSLGTVALLTSCVQKHRPEHARTTLWILALVPFDAFYCALPLTEVLTAFCLSLAVTIPWLLSEHRARWLIAGACWGLTALARDVYLMFALPMALYAVWQLQPRGNGGVRAGQSANRRWAPLAMVPVMLLVIAPWTVRNYLATGQIAPVTKGFLGYSIWQGTWERDGTWTNPPQRFPDYAFDSPRERELVERIQFKTNTPLRDTLKQDKFLQALAIERIKKRPLGTLATWARRFPSSWVGTRAELIPFRESVLPRASARWKLFKAACFALNAALLLLGAVGIVSAWKKRDVFYGWLALPPILNAIAYIPLHSTETRYSHPVLPALLCLSALGASVLWQKLKARRSAPEQAQGAQSTPRAVAG